MKETEQKAFQEQLYQAIGQTAHTVSVPPFETVAARIRQDIPIESYEQFFGEKPKGFVGRSRAYRIAAGTAAAVLLVIGTSLIGNLLSAPQFDTSNAAQSSCSVYDETAEKLEDIETVQDESIWDENSMKQSDMAENLMDDSFDVCAPIILSGGKTVMMPLEQLLNDSAENR